MIYEQQNLEIEPAVVALGLVYAISIVASIIWLA